MRSVSVSVVGQPRVVHADRRMGRIHGLGVLREDILAVQSLDGVLMACSDRVVIRAGGGNRVGGWAGGSNARNQGGGQDDKLLGRNGEIPPNHSRFIQNTQKASNHERSFQGAQKSWFEFLILVTNFILRERGLK